MIFFRQLFQRKEINENNCCSGPDGIRHRIGVRRTPVICYGVSLGWLVPGITLKLAGNRRHKSVKVYIVGQKIEIFGRFFFKNLFSFHHIGAK